MKKLIFCKDCKHHAKGKKCDYVIGTTKQNAFWGKRTMAYYPKCDVANRSNQCPHYTPRKQELK